MVETLGQISFIFMAWVVITGMIVLIINRK